MESRGSSLETLSTSRQDEEKKAFLEPVRLEDFQDSTNDETPITRSRRYSRWSICILHGGLIVGYSMVFLLAWSRLQTRYKHGADLFFSPVRDSILLEPRSFNVSHATQFPLKYFGHPSDAIDDAWEDLLRPSNNWFTHDEVGRFGGVDGDPVILPNGTHYGGLSVYHQLHCIKRLYWTLYPEQYYPNLTHYQKQLLLGHSMHCLDFLRQAVQCQGDISPMIFTWAENQPIPVGDLSYKHECVNWDALNTWASSRTIDPYVPGLVIHPKFGPAYANQSGEPRVGAVSDDPEHTNGGDL